MAARRAASSWPPPPSPEPRCGLCDRAVPALTEHHLIPRSQGRRRGLAVSTLPTVMLCSPCHKFLHRTFTNAELAGEYRDLAALRTQPDVQKFVTWLRTQPATKGVRVR